MRAGVVYEPMDIRVEEVEMPSPGYGEILLEVKSAGICGSDLHYHRSKPEGKPVRRIMGGHELSGRIAEVGEGVKSRKAGERVGVEPLLGCGECYFCGKGYYHLCKRLTHPGGGFREYTVLSEKKVFPLPDNVSYDEAAILDCLAVGVHAVHRAGIGITDTVAVFGDGAIGLSTMEVAKSAGAKRVAIIGHHDGNLEIARKVGTDVAVNSAKSDAAEAIMNMTDETGCDVVFETVGGASSTMENAVQIAKSGGRIVVVGVFTKPPQFNFMHLLRNEIDFIFSWSYSTWNGVPEFEIALDMLSSGKLDAKSLITHKFPLDRISEAFQTALNKGESGALKVLITY